MDNRRVARVRKLTDEQRKFNAKLAKIKHRYGKAAAATWLILFSAQDGRCAICGRPGGGDKEKSLDLDHHHRTFEVRGLLCGSCNRGLGLFADSIERLQSAIKYLRRK